MLYILDYGGGNVASLGRFLSLQFCLYWKGVSDSNCNNSNLFFSKIANSVRSLGFEFKWVETAEDIEKADVS